MWLKKETETNKQTNKGMWILDLIGQHGAVGIRGGEDDDSPSGGVPDGLGNKMDIGTAQLGSVEATQGVGGDAAGHGDVEGEGVSGAEPGQRHKAVGERAPGCGFVGATVHCPKHSAPLFVVD